MNVLLFQRLLFTAIIIAVAYYFLHRVWTKNVDVRAWFKSVSEAIPVAQERIIVNTG